MFRNSCYRVGDIHLGRAVDDDIDDTDSSTSKDEYIYRF